MSYGYNREDENTGERGRGSYGEQRHHGNQEERYNRDDEGNVETGGYGRDAEPTYGHGNREGGRSSGGYSPEARRNLQSHGFEERTSEYDRPQRQRQDEERGDYGHRQGGHEDEETPSYGRSGRPAIGSGESYVGLNRSGDEGRRTSDAYGGESGNHSASGGTYVSGGGDKWKPGQTMVFQAAETESEKNPYAADAQQLAGDTQGLLKDRVKQLESWAETKVKEITGSGK
ncbi:hypothetical protein M408DRAFT_92492 [Serendipita vermifera MAFF 305830]|uniref:Uncharacterized protein n=1 Tax=Serendipita vermifera MAFF 305830 TaxID=933852 RepID=A0A0C3BS69_SERVB|nr:hypothetical protein M408DRAFT_92492 [Serendipita vermifera MAFF 305830]